MMTLGCWIQELNFCARISRNIQDFIGKIKFDHWKQSPKILNNMEQMDEECN